MPLDWIWGLTSLLSNKYWGLVYEDIRLTTHLGVVPRFKTSWSYTSFLLYIFNIGLIKTHIQIHLVLYLFKNYDISQNVTHNHVSHHSDICYSVPQ
jgi:hypothetical protein